MVSESVRACAYLLRAIGPAAPTVASFVAECGVTAAAASIRAGNAPVDVMAEVARTDIEQQVDADVARLTSGEWRLITPECEAWPMSALSVLTNHGGPPLGLWVSGSAPLDTVIKHTVAVIGTDMPSSYGSYVATELGFHLATVGVTVVSRLAQGVSTEAFRGSVVASGQPIAALPCGVDAIPTAHLRMRERICAEGGLIVSEYPPDVPPTRARVRRTECLVVALAASTVIVEARQDSLAVDTARFAHALGRPVFGVPGEIRSITSAGVHQLLRAGEATLVTSVKQIR